MVISVSWVSNTSPIVSSKVYDFLSKLKKSFFFFFIKYWNRENGRDSFLKIKASFIPQEKVKVGISRVSEIKIYPKAR